MSEKIIQIETDRHSVIYNAIDEYKIDRTAQLSLHDSRMKTLETERLESLNWNEKNEITERMMEHAKKDPRKYLIPFENTDSPYFGIVGIHDEDVKIGIKEYVFGKQSLINKVKPFVIDWRKAEVSRLYYEYDEGDTYEEEFVNKFGTIDRVGKITHKRTVNIIQKMLRSIDTTSGLYKNVNGEWVKNEVNGEQVAISADIKTDSGNHELIDIVALISAKQFATITKTDSGCVFLTGAAGSGKTTVGIHALSFKKFNFPEMYRDERCMVIVFNKTLRDYVKNTSTELLGTSPVDTFASWAIKALSQMGVSNKSYKMSIKLNEYNELKKHSDMAEILSSFVKNTPYNANAIEDLFEFYKCKPLTDRFFKDDESARDGFLLQAAYIREHNEISFADLAILLRLCQLRNKDEEVEQAFNYFDHIVADEAQDFSKIELEAIYAALGPKKSLTICADEKQRILGFVDAAGLSQFKENLHTIGLDKTTFTVGYRSAPEIMDVANVIAGRQEGPPLVNNDVVKVVQVSDKNKAAEELAKIIQEYQKQDPSSLTAVICKGRTDIPFIHESLSKPQNGIVNLHPAGSIIFTPGVVITNAHQVKGLEFTNVIAWNPSSNIYRNSDEDRNLLYVVISRACKRLSIIHWQKLSGWFK